MDEIIRIGMGAADIIQTMAGHVIVGYQDDLDVIFVHKYRFLQTV